MREISQGPRKEIRVLVIDESSDFFDQVKDQAALNSHVFDMSCRLISESADAVSQLADWAPNVVVLDVAQSPFESAEIAKGCQQMEVPLIVTGDTHNHEIQQAIEKIGAIAYVVKSEDPDDLEQVVELLAQVSREPQAVH